MFARGSICSSSSLLGDQAGVCCCSPFGSHVLEVLLAQLTKSEHRPEYSSAGCETVRLQSVSASLIHVCAELYSPELH